MTTIATGIFKQLRYKIEATLATLPGATGAQLLRRVKSSLDLVKDTYKSNEIRTDQQRAVFRHGARSVAGTINGELSVGTYAAFMAAVLRKVFVAIAPSTAVSLTIAASAPNWTVTRAAGSFLTDGIKIGDVVRLSVGALNAANISKNLLVLGVTGTVLTVYPLNSVALVAEGPVAGCTVTVVGKKSWIPTSGHVNQSFSIEHWFSDIAQSETFTGCRMSKMDVKLPASGMATVDFSVMGVNLVAGTAAYYTTPTAANTGEALQAVNGALYVDGVAVALITSLDFSANGNTSVDKVVGSNTTPDVFVGPIDVTGNMTVYFIDAVMRDIFLNETEASILAAFTADNTAASEFMAFAMTRVKAGGSQKDDGEKGLMMTMPFTALLDTAGGTGLATENTTLSIQDSTL